MFPVGSKTDLERLRFRPLAGVGCFMSIAIGRVAQSGFPSPCGVWVVSVPRDGVLLASEFPSPCGVWVVSVRALPPPRAIRDFRPLAGCGLFLLSGGLHETVTSFRPLAGCGLFQTNNELTYADIEVSVPLRGVGCFCAILSR